LILLIPVALTLVFLLLYIQFRRVVTTLIIYSGVVLCVAGGFILIWLYGQPWFLGFEVFGTLFDLIGTSVQFAALGLVLIAALFIKRPWCNYLCPIRPVVDLIRLVRQTVKERWQKATLKTRSA